MEESIEGREHCLHFGDSSGGPGKSCESRNPSCSQARAKEFSLHHSRKSASKYPFTLDLAPWSCDKRDSLNPNSPQPKQAKKVSFQNGGQRAALATKRKQRKVLFSALNPPFLLQQQRGLDQTGQSSPWEVLHDVDIKTSGLEGSGVPDRPKGGNEDWGALKEVNPGTLDRQSACLHLVLEAHLRRFLVGGPGGNMDPEHNLPVVATLFRVPRARRWLRPSLPGFFNQEFHEHFWIRVEHGLDAHRHVLGVLGRVVEG